MISCQFDDMTCGHCVNAITKAVKAADKDAAVQIDLAAHRVDIEAGTVDAVALANAIRNAGYIPVVLDGDSSSSAPATSGKCGCRRQVWLPRASVAAAGKALAVTRFPFPVVDSPVWTIRQIRPVGWYARAR